MSDIDMIVVRAVPVKDELTETYKWTRFLSASHLIYFVYMVVTTLGSNNTDNENTTTLLTLTFNLVVCGIYVPMAIYNNSRRGNVRLTHMFVLLLVILSLLMFVSSLSTMGTFIEVRQICKDCKDIFQAGNDTCVTEYESIDSTYEIALTQEECDMTNDLTPIITNECLQLFISIVGFITACKSKANNKTTKTYASVVSPQEVSIIQVNGQPVLARTEHVPDINV